MIVRCDTIMNEPPCGRCSVIVNRANAFRETIAEQVKGRTTHELRHTPAALCRGAGSGIGAVWGSNVDASASDLYPGSGVADPSVRTGMGHSWRAGYRAMYGCRVSRRVLEGRVGTSADPISCSTGPRAQAAPNEGLG